MQHFIIIFWFTLILNVLQNHIFIRILTNSIYIVPRSPKIAAPQFFFYFRMKPKKLFRYNTFYCLSYTFYRQHWYTLNQKMNMIFIRSYFNKMYFIATLDIFTNFYHVLPLPAQKKHFFYILLDKPNDKEAELKNLSAISQLTNIRKLQMKNCGLFDKVSDISLTNIVELTVSNTNINSNNFIFPLNINKVTFDALELTNVGLLKNLNHLESLEIKRCVMLDDLSAISLLPKLFSLTISNCSEVSDLSFISSSKPKFACVFGL